MKVALDATPLTEITGGVSRYTADLSCALASCFPEDEYWLVSDQPFAFPACKAANLRSGRGPGNLLARRWWVWGLQGEIARLGIDVFHGTDFAVPYVPVRPSVMTVHDLSPWLDPGWHVSAERVRTRTPLLLRLGLATLVITPSEAVRRASMERFRLPPERVVAVPHAARALFRPQPPLLDPRRPYFVYVGTLEPRKNLQFLIDVWRAIRDELGVDLVLAGRRRDDFHAELDEPGLHWLGPVPDEELPELYSGAIACVYPSLYEGFGLPVLEAMQCGAAVIASNDPAIAEIASGAAVLLDPRDAAGWTEALRAAVNGGESLQDLRARSLVRAADFSWERTARATREVYLAAQSKFRRTV